MASAWGFLCSRHWVANTWPTSVVPMPKASAPNAPWVLVWLSPHTIVCPGWLKPSSGPMTCTMPRCACRIASSSTPNSAQLLFQLRHLASRRVDGDRRAAEHLGALSRGGVIHGGERAVRAPHREPALAQHLEGLRGGHLVDEVQVDVEHRGHVRRAGRDLVAAATPCRKRARGVLHRLQALLGVRISRRLRPWERPCRRSRASPTCRPSCR